MLLAIIDNDAAVLGLLAFTLGFVFYTSNLHSGFWPRFYSVVPSLLLCYFLPGLYNSLGIVDGEASQLYPVISRYLLPTSLILLTLNVNFYSLKQLGNKALIMFAAGVIGIMLGGPIAVFVFKFISPETVGGTGPSAVWRGLATIAGSWIGGSANQTALKEVFGVDDTLFSAMIAMDVLVANLWMAILLVGAGKHTAIDKWLGAKGNVVADMKASLQTLQPEKPIIPGTHHLILICAIGFGFMGLSHFFADALVPFIEQNAPQLKSFSLTSSFFWIIFFATSFGLLLALTPARKLEQVGASKVGTVLLYFLIASVGMRMNILAIFKHPLLFGVGAIWMAVHVLVLLITAKVIKAPFFYCAVSSQACVGGVASTSIVANAFSPLLVPIGVLLAVLGYGVGTYGAYLSGLMMQWISLHF